MRVIIMHQTNARWGAGAIPRAELNPRQKLFRLPLLRGEFPVDSGTLM